MIHAAIRKYFRPPCDFTRPARFPGVPARQPARIRPVVEAEYMAPELARLVEEVWLQPGLARDQVVEDFPPSPLVNSPAS